MTEDLLAHITSRIDVNGFYSEYVEGYKPDEFSRLYHCPFPFHDDSTPSFQVNRNGSFFCHGCKASGGGPVKFFAEINEIKNWGRALEEAYIKYVRSSTVKRSTLKKYRVNLTNDMEVIERLEKERGWDRSRMMFLGLGMTGNGKRITIPYFNEYDMCTCLWYYNVLKEGNYAKIRPAEGKNDKDPLSGMETGRLWPRDTLKRGDTIIICEGHGDCILLLSMGYAAMTLGSSNYPLVAKDLAELKKKEIVLIYDNDEPGRAGSEAVKRQLLEAGIQTKHVALPILDTEKHKDITDYFIEEKQTQESFNKLMAGTEYSVAEAPIFIGSRVVDDEADPADPSNASEGSTQPSSSFPFVSLLTARESSQYEKGYRTEGVVVGKESSVLHVPHVIELECMSPKSKCPEGCRLKWAVDNKVMKRFSADDRLIVRYIEASEYQERKFMREDLGIKAGCSLSHRVMETHAVTKVLVAPPIYRSESMNTEAIQVFGYYFGVDIIMNNTYVFEGYTGRYREDQKHACVFTKATPVTSTLHTFKLTQEMRDDLAAFRMPGDGRPLFNQLIEFYDHCARSITRIWERPLIHMGIDLVFHSPVSFTFSGDFQRKGSLDVLVFGDTGTGKNRITDNLQAYYEHGETISGENVSPMNLIGGIRSVSKFRGPAWGRFVMRHRDTIIVDEMEAIPVRHFGLLSRIRDHGIANLDKDGLHLEAEAICGIIWLSNQRDHQRMADYQFGIQALKNLVPGNQDRRRFDYVMALAHGDVSSKVINRSDVLLEKHKFTKEQCHNLILWIKSRRPDQIEFTPECVAYIMKESDRLGREYDDEYPLALAEHVRFKLAKIAASIAGRIFSTTSNEEVLLVTKRCAEAAVTFLDSIYQSETLGFKMFSEVFAKWAEFDKDALDKELKSYANTAGIGYKDLCTILASLNEPFSFDHLQAVLNFELATIKNLKNLLAKFSCVQQRGKGNEYLKSRKFIKFLKERVK